MFQFVVLMLLIASEADVRGQEGERGALEEPWTHNDPTGKENTKPRDSTKDEKDFTDQKDKNTKRGQPQIRHETTSTKVKNNVRLTLSSVLRPQRTNKRLDSTKGHKQDESVSDMDKHKHSNAYPNRTIKKSDKQQTQSAGLEHAASGLQDNLKFSDVDKQNKSDSNSKGSIRQNDHHQQAQSEGMEQADSRIQDPDSNDSVTTSTTKDGMHAADSQLSSEQPLEIVSGDTDGGKTTTNLTEEEAAALMSRYHNLTAQLGSLQAERRALQQVYEGLLVEYKQELETSVLELETAKQELQELKTQLSEPQTFSRNSVTAIISVQHLLMLAPARLVSPVERHVDDNLQLGSRAPSPAFEVLLSDLADNLFGEETPKKTPLYAKDKIKFDFVSYDTQRNYNTTTGTFLVPVSGRYLFWASFKYFKGGQTSFHIFSQRKTIGSFSSKANTGHIGLAHIKTIANLVEGDLVWCASEYDVMVIDQFSNFGGLLVK